jgi:hypothetical protein
LKTHDHPLFAVNDSEIPIHGITPGLSFEIAGHLVNMTFLVVDNMGRDEMILGRDFMRKYDVLVDTPRNTIKIRNMDQEYTTVEKYEVQSKKQSLQARILGRQYSPADSIEQFNFKIKRRSKSKTFLNVRRWLGYTEEMEDSGLGEAGIRAGAGIVLVENLKLRLALSNTNSKTHDATCLSHRSNSGVRITPVTIHYQNVPRHNQEMQKAIKMIELKQRGSLDPENMEDDTSLPSSAATFRSGSDLPIEKDTPDKFPTKPDYTHIREEVNDEQWGKLEKVMEEHKDLFMQFRRGCGPNRPTRTRN